MIKIQLTEPIILHHNTLSITICPIRPYRDKKDVLHSGNIQIYPTSSRPGPDQDHQFLVRRVGSDGDLTLLDERVPSSCIILEPKLD